MMADDTFTMHGQLDPWLSKEKTAKLFKLAGFTISVGEHSVRLHLCDIFSFESFGFGEPRIECDGTDLASMLTDLGRVSDTLAKANIRHRFELYGSESDDGMCAYFHHRWPLEP